MAGNCSYHWFEAADGDVARLQIKDICEFTGLCERTVKTCVGELIAAGIIVRVGRVGAFAIPMLQDAGEPQPGPRFTAKQAATVRKALREAGLCLVLILARSKCRFRLRATGSGPANHLSCCIPVHQPGPDREIARRFVGLVLEFRHSESVGGTPVLFSVHA